MLVPLSLLSSSSERYSSAEEALPEFELPELSVFELHDKRETAAKRDAARAIDRAMKEQNR